MKWTVRKENLTGIRVSVGQGKEMAPDGRQGEWGVPGEGKGQERNSDEVFSQGCTRERFPVEIKEERGTFEMHGDTVTRFVL